MNDVLGIEIKVGDKGIYFHANRNGTIYNTFCEVVGFTEKMMRIKSVSSRTTLIASTESKFIVVNDLMVNMDTSTLIKTFWRLNKDD